MDKGPDGFKMDLNGSWEIITADDVTAFRKMFSQWNQSMEELCLYSTTLQELNKELLAENRVLRTEATKLIEKNAQLVAEGKARRNL